MPPTHGHGPGHLYASCAKLTKWGMFLPSVKAPMRSNQRGCTKWCSVTMGFRLFLQGSVIKVTQELASMLKVRQHGAYVRRSGMCPSTWGRAHTAACCTGAGTPEQAIQDGMVAVQRALVDSSLLRLDARPLCSSTPCCSPQELAMAAASSHSVEALAGGQCDLGAYWQRRRRI